MTLVHKERNVYFDPLQIVYDVIRSNVLDPNPERRERSSEDERRWIFPTTPESNDENYPRIAIIHGRATVEEWTAGQFVEYIKDPAQKLVREVNSNIVRIPVTIGVFTKKTRHKSFEVTDYDGTKRYVENSAQVVWLLDRIQNALHRNRRAFIDKDTDIEIKDMEGAYEDNDFLWAGDIQMDIVIKNVWTNDIPNIIENIGLNLTVELTNG